MARESGSSGGAQQDRRLIVRVVVGAVVLVVILAFILQNRSSTPLNWLFFSFDWPLWLLLTVVGLLSFVLGWLVGRRRPSAR